MTSRTTVQSFCNTLNKPHKLPSVIITLIVKYLHFHKFDIYDQSLIKKLPNNIYECNNQSSLTSSIPVKDGHMAKIKLLNKLTGSNSIRIGVKDTIQKGTIKDYCFTLYCTRNIGYTEKTYKDEVLDMTINQTGYATLDWGIKPNDTITIKRKQNTIIWLINNKQIAFQKISFLNDINIFYWLCFNGYTYDHQRIKIQLS